MKIEDYPLTWLPRARQDLDAHIGMSALLDDAEARPDDMAALCASVDAAIAGYNAVGRWDVPAYMPNLAEAKGMAETVPTIREMVAPDRPDGTCLRYAMALSTIDWLMDRAEVEKPEEPYLAFHRWEGANWKEKMLGGLVQAYGHIVALRTRNMNGRVDMFLDGLLEIIVNDWKKNIGSPFLITALDRGWYTARDEAGNYLFSEETRDQAAAAAVFLDAQRA